VTIFFTVNGSQLTCTASAHGAVNDVARATDDVHEHQGASRDHQIATVGADGMLRVWALGTMQCVKGVQVRCLRRCCCCCCRL
jgi:hypothetical protein